MNEPLLDERVDDFAILLEASPELREGLLAHDVSDLGDLHVSATTPEVWLG